MLKDVRDLALNEYLQFYVRSKKFYANRNVNAIMSGLAAATGGFQGSVLGIISAEKRRPKLVGPAGLGFLISGATIVATPPASRISAIVQGKLAREKLSAELGEIGTKSVQKLDTDIAALATLIKRQSQAEGPAPNVERRLTAYSKQSALLTAQNAINAKEKALSDREFKERMFFAAGIGGTKMSWGINLANAGFRYHTQLAFQPAKGAARARYIASAAPPKVFTKRVAAGATSYIPGTSLWILDTLQNRVRGIARDQALARQNAAPGTLLKERLERVDEIDDAFNY